ncbi:MAG: type II toxin-antitoxin system HicB family antitoxin [Spirochaetales bacterium]|jgi:predicted RNase H-like HicB family nuclease|nr:type II toxin-antitoxin system HicB family antitoxin [Spirochaetales bacterium]
MKHQFTYWRDGDYFLGYLNEYPDYETQGLSFEELKTNLMSLYKDIVSDEIPYIRKVGELVIA